MENKSRLRHQIRLATNNNVGGTAKYSWIVFVDGIKTVWFSSRWISASSIGPSTDSTPRRQRTTYGCLSDSGRSGWSHDSSCTTRHLWTSLHMSLTTRRCPDLKCWISSQDAVMSSSHLFYNKCYRISIKIGMRILARESKYSLFLME